MIRTALALGRTPRELLASTTARELMELQAYDMISPIGDDGAYLRAAQIVGTLGADGKSKSLRDFDVRTWMEPKKKQSSASMAEMLANAFGVNRKK